MSAGLPISSGGAAPSTNQPHQTDTDPLVKYQTLLPILKESVTNMIKHTMYILQTTIGGQCRQNEVQMLNKCLEDFYNISDQIHHWLNLADSTVDYYLMGSKFSDEVTSSFNTTTLATPSGENVNKNSGLSNTLFYSEYLTNAKRQVAATQELRNLLSEFAESLGKDD